MNKLLATSVRWKGQVYTLGRNGYLTDGKRYLHRIKWEFYRGAIPQGWHVHHINHDRADNRMINLIALPASKHVSEHAKERNSINVCHTVTARQNAALTKSQAEYKARIKTILKEVHNRILHPKRACVICGAINFCKREKQTTCSQSCFDRLPHRKEKSKKYARARREQGVCSHTLVCMVCKLSFSTNKSKSKCCSRRCGTVYGHMQRGHTMKEKSCLN